ncbi:uncharacterized protein BX663DRAFT_233 [Cokeromyces recurvatus]|uniref:uncharacterized protein n=1 Tax=Cokeromyces recurvatus TaxID=90255 RepID=UPI00221E9E5C|nr:uncharacterized protein BX663DRAFT_233 [Cokeromyces recurvatus]KAI7907430.1 hypothetical protein BX663DRAFT_233 [Cokeromyces recurvatus]
MFIVISDIRQRTTAHTFSAHHSRIRSITIDTENKLLVTGSVDGELKVYTKSIILFYYNIYFYRYGMPVHINFKNHSIFNREIDSLHHLLIESLYVDMK